MNHRLLFICLAGFVMIAVVLAVFLLVETRDSVRIPVKEINPVNEDTGETAQPATSTIQMVGDVIVIPRNTGPGRAHLGECGQIMSTSTLSNVQTFFHGYWTNTSRLGDGLIIQDNYELGWNLAVVPLFDYKVNGYCLVYPMEWPIHLVGVDSMNLIFTDSVSTSTRKLYLQVTGGSLTLEDAYKATYGYEGPGHPLMSSSEIIISKKIKEFDKNKALVVSSEKDNTYNRRYFLVHGNSIYMFLASFEKQNVGGEDFNETIEAIEKMVGSLRFMNIFWT